MVPTPSEMRYGRPADVSKPCPVVWSAEVMRKTVEFLEMNP